jgi:hypothetical protein
VLFNTTENRPDGELAIGVLVCSLRLAAFSLYLRMLSLHVHNMTDSDDAGSYTGIGIAEFVLLVVMAIILQFVCVAVAEVDKDENDRK